MIVRVIIVEAIWVLGNPTICGVSLIVSLSIELDVLLLLEGFKVSEPMSIDPVASDRTFGFTSNTAALETLARAESPVDVLGRLIINVIIVIELIFISVKEGTVSARERFVCRVNICDLVILDGIVEKFISLASECFKIDIGANSHAIPKTRICTKEEAEAELDIGSHVSVRESEGEVTMEFVSSLVSTEVVVVI